MINKAKDQKSAGAANHLANERTFLAWIRTSLALMGFGFVIVKFTLFINQITTALGEKNVIPVKGYSATIGIIMVVMVAIMATKTTLISLPDGCPELLLLLLLLLVYYWRYIYCQMLNSYQIILKF